MDQVRLVRITAPSVDAKALRYVLYNIDSSPKNEINGEGIGLCSQP